MENLAPHKEEVRLAGPEHFPWGEATFRATKYKPWLNERDAEEVLFVSVHGYGGRDLAGRGAFYPGGLWGLGVGVGVVSFRPFLFLFGVVCWGV